MRAQIATHAGVTDLMRQYKYLPKKSLGQNFLTDPGVVDKIVSAARITREDCVIEIGPGLGGLTQVLSDRAAAVMAVEIDKRLVAILKEVFADNSRIEILEGDILKTSVNALMKERGWQTAKLTANIPYYITTPVILGLLENHCPLSLITVIVQLEVAERLTAKPGGKEYGALSLAAAYYADVSLAAIVPRNCFFPRPHVSSAIVILDKKKPLLNPYDEEMLFKCIKAAFSHRRKTLINCLRAQDWVNKGREELLAILQTCGFDENIRGEELSLDEFIRLAYTLNA